MRPLRDFGTPETPINHAASSPEASDQIITRLAVEARIWNGASSIERQASRITEASRAQPSSAR